MGGKKNQIHVVQNDDGTWANKKPMPKGHPLFTKLKLKQ